MLTIPAFSFITFFSKAFFNRQSQIASVAHTGLFNKDLVIDIKTLQTNIIKVTKSSDVFYIIFIVPYYKFLGELFDGEENINSGLQFGFISLLRYVELSRFVKNLAEPDFATYNDRSLFVFCFFNN